MTFTKRNISDWKKYERVRASGRWNMITHSYYAMRDAKLSRECYLFCLNNYSELKAAAEKSPLNRPTEDALKLASRMFIWGEMTTESLAEMIDKELLLPEKHAALLLAQGVVDSEAKWNGSFGPERDSMIETIDQLRGALSCIKSG